jgi:hypothetical protein
MSEKRAPGPGAIRKVEWAPLAKTYLQDKQVILHTDAAKTYKMHIPGVVHDNVIHAEEGEDQWEMAVAKPFLRPHRHAQSSRCEEAN